MTSNAIIARIAGATAALLNPALASHFEVCAEAANTFLLEHAAEITAANADDGFWPSADSWMALYRPYKVVNGTLQIPVKGVLLHNFPYALGDWATGYEYITRAIARGLDDGSVRRIALIVDSPGGEVAGCFECAEKIVAARDVKPIEAFAHESAYSAAYVLASSTSKITVSRTGGVGSMGVVTSHLDQSERMKQLGLKLTFIASDPTKTEGNSYEPLGDDAKARIHARVMDLYSIYVEHVVATRGIDEDTIRGTLKALCFTAAEAKSNGLADAIGPLDDALASFEAEMSTETENETMSTQDTSAANEAVSAEALAAARTEGTTAGRTEGAKAERERIAAIKALDEAKDRPVAAENVAMKTNMTVEEAKDFLAGMPSEKTTDEGDGTAATAGAGANRFDAAMQNGNPNLSGNDAGEGEEHEEQATSGEAGAKVLLSARVAATGFGRKDK